MEGLDKIINLDLGSEDSKDIIYKKVMGTIFYLNDNKFEYRDNVLQQQLSCYKINEKNIYAYITPGYRDIRLRTDLINEDTYMFSRNYFFNLNHYEYF